MIRTTFILFGLMVGPVMADPAVIERIAASPQGEVWRFDVTLSHGDTGWDDYADGWRVELADGTVLATRTLLHPHVNEQPFTRSQSGIDVPGDVTEVFVRASTNVEGWADQTTTFAIER
ncbi:MAG: hypothetical protein AAGM21_02980 [Pseudomonadota bacterium]